MVAVLWGSDVDAPRTVRTPALVRSVLRAVPIERAAVHCRLRHGDDLELERGWVGVCGP